MKTDEDEIVLRKVKSGDIVFRSKDIHEILKEFRKYPLYDVSIERPIPPGVIVL